MEPVTRQEMIETMEGQIKFLEEILHGDKSGSGSLPR
jgi:hypothetical protein